jgi:hypothetical protein
VSATKLLDRLERVRQTGAGRWIACCRAHKDRSPSLSVRELDDGRTLIYCFAGCSTEDVLAAAGLTMSDLFPKPLQGSGPAGGYPSSHSRIPAPDLLQIIDHEVLTAALVLSWVVEQNGICTQSQLQRLTQAAARIGRARDHACPAAVHPSKTGFQHAG